MQVWFHERLDQIGQTRFFLWMRIIAGGLVAVAGALSFWEHPSNILDWVRNVSLASFFLFLRLRQPNEPFREYVVKPRAILTIVSVIIALVSSSLWLARHL
jgi:hypothetical protein